MKKLLIAATSVATLAFAGTASAQTQQVDINANVASKCGVSAQQTTITLGDLTNSQALVRTAVTQEIATALNNAQVIAFCNAPNSSVNVERSVLARTGSGAGSGLTDGGFAQNVRYNLDVEIGNLFLDSTSTAGASTVANRFGGHNSASSAATHLRFEPAATSGNAVASTNGSSPTSTDWSSVTDRRLAAGNYTGYVSVTLTPGA